MSGLELVAGIAGILSLTIEVSKITTSYIRGVRDASSGIHSLVRELQALKRVLIQLDELASELDDEYQDGNRQFAMLSVENSDEYRQTLEELRRKLEKRMQGNSLAVKLKSLKWPFSESSTQKTVDLLHRHLEIFKGALSIDTL